MGVMDFVFAAIAGISIAFGFWRGLTRELVSMIAWVLIAVIAFRFSGPLGRMLPFEAPGLVHVAIGALLIVIFGLIAAAIVGRLLRAVIVASNLAGADRVLGAVFGALRGALVALVLTWIAVEAGFSDTHLWRDSASGPYLEHVYHWMAGTVPNRRVPLVMLTGD
jgi:membrane protein required for colicin V production